MTVDIASFGAEPTPNALRPPTTRITGRVRALKRATDLGLQASQDLVHAGISNVIVVAEAPRNVSATRVEISQRLTLGVEAREHEVPVHGKTNHGCMIHFNGHCLVAVRDCMTMIADVRIDMAAAFVEWGERVRVKNGMQGSWCVETRAVEREAETCPPGVLGRNRGDDWLDWDHVGDRSTGLNVACLTLDAGVVVLWIDVRPSGCEAGFLGIRHAHFAAVRIVESPPLVLVEELEVGDERPVGGIDFTFMQPDT